MSDRLAIRNERIKLAAAFANALGLGLIGFALLRPAVEEVDTLALRNALWALSGVAFHLLAHYILGMLRQDPS